MTELERLAARTQGLIPMETAVQLAKRGACPYARRTQACAMRGRPPPITILDFPPVVIPIADLEDVPDQFSHRIALARDRERAAVAARVNANPHFESIRRGYSEGANVPPIMLIYWAGRPRELGDGNHRLYVARDLGLDAIPVVIRTIDRELVADADLVERVALITGLDPAAIVEQAGRTAYAHRCSACRLRVLNGKVLLDRTPDAT